MHQAKSHEKINNKKDYQAILSKIINNIKELGFVSHKYRQISTSVVNAIFFFIKLFAQNSWCVKRAKIHATCHMDIITFLSIS